MTTKERYWKNPKYGMVYSQYFKSPPGILFWLHLDEPKDGPPGENGEPGKPRFEASIAFDKNTPEAKEYLQKLEADREPMLSLFNKGRKGGKMAISTEELVTDGNTFDTVKYPFLKDKYVITARNAKQVAVVGVDGKSAIPYKDLEPGMEGVLVFTPFICSHGMKFRLELVQYQKDTGLRVGGARPNPGSMLEMVKIEPEVAASGASEPSLAESLNSVLG